MRNIKNNALLFIGTLCFAGVSGVAFAAPIPAPEMDGALIGQIGVLMSGVVLIARRAMNKSKNK